MPSNLLSNEFIRNVRSTARVLDILNHRLRKRILDEIEVHDALNAEALAGLLDVRSNLITQHLEILRKEGIVDIDLEGKQFFYSINYNRIEKINQVIHGLAEK